MKSKDIGGTPGHFSNPLIIYPTSTTQNRQKPRITEGYWRDAEKHRRKTGIYIYYPKSRNAGGTPVGRRKDTGEKPLNHTSHIKAAETKKQTPEKCRKKHQRDIGRTPGHIIPYLLSRKNRGNQERKCEGIHYPKSGSQMRQ